ncbi:NAD(+) diphosphatase [Thermodesulfobacteriota bacterium]
MDLPGRSLEEGNSAMSFNQSFTAPPRIPENALWFLFQEQKLLTKKRGNRYLIPRSRDLQALDPRPEPLHYLGSLEGRSCYAGEMAPSELPPPTFAFKGIRSLFGHLEEALIGVAGLANQLVLWGRNHRFCGRCGLGTEDKADERAKICPGCGQVNYPRLSPAVIVAVVRDDRLLLAHSQRFPGKFYSVLAGFVEPGETLEECIEREIQEEVGIKVKNIRYFGSQPWPFPDSLMIAFTAEYAGGEINIDPAEIADAGWFSADNLPPIPPKISIARQLIDWFTENRD